MAGASNGEQGGLRARSWCGLEALEPDLRSYLGRRCRDRHDVDDAVQETLVRAARYRASLADPVRLRGWAMRIATNVLRDQRRRWGAPLGGALALDGQGDGPGVELELAPEPERDPPEEWLRLERHHVPREEALDLLARALASLRQDDRSVLDAYYAGSGGGPATARACGISPRLVKVRLFRARGRLRRAVRRLLALEGDRWIEGARGSGA